MVNAIGNSLLAAQIYSSAPGQADAATRPVERQPEFDEALQREQASARAPVRSFPVDRVEIPNAIEASEEAQDSSARFAREAPNAKAEQRYVAPGTYCDICV